MPQRLPLLQLRSSATFTAISFAAITSGLPATATAEAFLRAPLGWDYAHAAGFDTAYLSSQHGGFAGLGEWLKPSAITRRLFAEDLDSLAPHIPGADDRALLRRAPRELSALKEPYFAIVHLAGTHYPYVIDPRVTPFEPHGKESSEAGAAALLNRYRNAVHMQDRAIAGFLERLRETEAGRRTVVLFTSDHGESFFEHGVGLHGGTMNEEELHVPGWIDAPPGVLDDAERTALERARDAPTYGIDLLPTMLDLAGIWRQPALASTRATLPGVSWLGDTRLADRRVFVTNCSALWGCGVPVWSVLGDHRKWVERSGTPSCFDVFADPHERTPLDRARCADLAGLAETQRASLAPKR
jgi:arylsulfatase A-like enzyme